MLCTSRLSKLTYDSFAFIIGAITAEESSVLPSSQSNTVGVTDNLALPPPLI